MNYPFPFEPHKTSIENSRSIQIVNLDEFMVHESQMSMHSHTMSTNNYPVPNDM